MPTPNDPLSHLSDDDDLVAAHEAFDVLVEREEKVALAIDRGDIAAEKPPALMAFLGRGR